MEVALYIEVILQNQCQPILILRMASNVATSEGILMWERDIETFLLRKEPNHYGSSSSGSVNLQIAASCATAQKDAALQSDKFIIRERDLLNYRASTTFLSSIYLPFPSTTEAHLQAKHIHKESTPDKRSSGQVVGYQRKRNELEGGDGGSDANCER